MMYIILGRLTQFFYLIEITLLLVAFEKQEKIWQSLGEKLVHVCVFSHFLFLSALWYEAGLDSFKTRSGALILFSFLVILAYIVSSKGPKVKNIGIFIYLFVFLCISVSFVQLFKEPSSLVSSVVPKIWLIGHVGLALTGEACFLLAAVFSLFYLFEEEAIKKKHRLPFALRLPPLKLLEDVSIIFLKVGFLVISVGILIGSYFATKAFGKIWIIEPKQVLIILVWLIYGFLLAFRFVFNFDGKRIAIWSLSGFSLLILATIGVSFCPVGFHRFI